jgi:hypothetical protein
MNDGGEDRPGSDEAARPAAAANQAAKRPADRTATPRRRPGEKPFIPFARFEDVVVRCGHVEKFGLLPDGKDRFREGRRQKAISRDCKACRERKQREQEEAAQLRRAEKEKRKMLDAEQRRERAPRLPGGRLPDGSRFEVRYDAAKEQWSGSLTVPAAEGAPTTFTGSGSGLFPLLTRLDQQYRATLG